MTEQDDRPLLSAAEVSDRLEQALFEIRGRLAMKHGVSASRQEISQHLGVLEEAGLVTTERRGRYKLHHFDPTPLEVIIERWPRRRPKENE